MPDEIRDALVIFNPTAGRARSFRNGALERARKVLARQGIESELVPTDGPGSAPELARRAVREGRQMVIVCGGDGRPQLAQITHRSRTASGDGGEYSGGDDGA